MKKTLKHHLKYLLPVGVKKLIKYTLYSIQDFSNWIRRKKLNGYPPKRLNFVGNSSFKAVGDEFFGYFKGIGQLKKSDIVLDVGSGIGRMAIPLTHYLTEGELYGFDIYKKGVKWCQKNISPKFPNFNFEYVDLYNKYYNKKGKIKAEDFEFPYEDNKFDFIYATSVFTHMLPEEVKQYFSEIKRVLKKDGRCLLTFFGINENKKILIENGYSKCDFKYEFSKNCFYSHKNVPEAETAYSEEWIIKQFEKIECQSPKIYNGSWSGQKDSYSYQDIFIGTNK